jgi:Helicase HerA, central domain
MPADYEKLGLFYLGKRYDVAGNTRLADLILYDSRDLLTHAVVLGMTGSGKTGLGITLLEEAAIDGVPVLAIDPKGDLTNLLLTFPHLSASDFAPWVDRTEAARHQKTVGAWATETAQRWRTGLADWDQDGSRIARLREAADVRVYTPGSRAGLPLAILGQIGQSRHEPAEDAQARIAATSAGLLGLVGMTEVQSHSREQALISAILQGRPTETDTDFAWLVQQIQRPSFDRIGVLDLETFYPARDRQGLALRFNSVLARPGFELWSTGEPLQAGTLLFTPEGRPRVTIISIAHLDDAQRMLVVSMAFNAVLQWMRRQTGTSSLRALVYMDEVSGYLPPVANPPSKGPILTLLKQARAYGVGIALATQNPVDLDYKALSNIGTWFLGKLQTERDKARVLDGLEGLAGGLDRQTIDRMLPALRSRVFLMHNVHESGPVTFETRWTLSYLRGPMNRDELQRLCPVQTTQAAPTEALDAPAAEPHVSQARPAVPAGIREYFMKGDGRTVLAYRPVLYGAARIHYTDARRGINTVRSLQAVVPFSEGVIPVDWEHADVAVEPPDSLSDLKEIPRAAYEAVPAPALDPKNYVEWSRDFADWIQRAQPLTLFSSPTLKLVSEPDESERDFRIRCQQAGREARDSAVETLRARFAPRVARLNEKVRKAREVVEREEQQAGQQKLQTAVSLGATMLGALMGRRSVSLSALGRATTAARGVGRSMKEAQDIERAAVRLREAEAEFAVVEAELQQAIAALDETSHATTPLGVVEIKPKRGSVDIRLVALAWQPVSSAG